MVIIKNIFMLHERLKPQVYVNCFNVCRKSVLGYLGWRVHFEIIVWIFNTFDNFSGIKHRLIKILK